MNCIICAKAIRDLSAEGDNHPHGGTAFQSRGHYGSSVFDPMDGTFLEINICDPCLKVAGQNGCVLMGFPQPAPPRGPMVTWPLKVIERETFEEVDPRTADDDLASNVNPSACGKREGSP